MLSKQKTESIKKQLLSEINKAGIPNKEEIKKQIESMNEKQLEEFLKQNNIVGQEGQEKCIFCSIVTGELPSHKIAENDEAIAVLEINPVSLGHTIIIPKTHNKNTPKKAIELAKQIADSLKILKPKKIDIHPSSLFDHEILNVLPIYNNETLESERKKASEKDIKLLEEKIKKALYKLEEEPKVEEKKQEIISDKTHWLPKRIP